MNAAEACRHPLRLEPIAVPRVWGGDRILREIHPGITAAPPIGESWEVSDVGDGPALHSRVASGAAAGVTLRELLRAEPHALIGKRIVERQHGDATLPLLYKFIDAHESLSVQVHPSDKLLREQGRVGSGKDEAWVILDVAPGATIIYGLEAGIRYEDYLEQARAGRGDEGLRRVAVHRGDVVYLPAGTLHAIGGGILLAEIQQTSDITYRLHDWGRLGLDGKPRTLHLDEAAKVRPPRPHPPCPLARPARTARVARRVACDSFTLDVITLPRGELTLPQLPDRFAILSVLDGNAVARGPHESDRFPLGRGETLFVPAAAAGIALQATSSLWAVWMQPGDAALGDYPPS